MYRCYLHLTLVRTLCIHSDFSGLTESSDHQTLGGKDQWGKKKRSVLKSDHSSASGVAEGGFMSAPWKFITRSKQADADKENILHVKLPPVIQCS